jgi:uncharacterized membrane protein YfcA
LLIVPAIVSTVPIAYAVRHSEPDPLTVIAGAVCLAGVVALASGRQWRGMSSRVGTVVVGALSGGMNATAGIGGPPIVLFAVNARWPLERARPTMQLFFLGLNAVTLASLGWPGHLPLEVVAGFAAGVMAGTLFAGRLPERVIRPATLAIAATGSVLAIARGLSG